MTTEELTSSLVLPDSSHAVESFSAYLEGASSYSDTARTPTGSDTSTENTFSKASDRESRNRAEKERRNKLNAHINEISNLVPTVIESSRKIDKTGILRLAANYLRDEHVFGKKIVESIRNYSTDVQPRQVVSLLEILGGFILGVTCKGVIFVVSANVQTYLGHCDIDLFGQNLYSMVHRDDWRVLEQHILPPELRTLNGDPESQVFGHRQNFMIRIMRASPRSEPVRYETCLIDGSLRRSDHAKKNGLLESQVIRRQRVRRDRTITSSGNDVVFIGMVRLMTRDMPPIMPEAATHSEYWTRHLIDGRIVQCDQRISLVAGYMAEEVSGLSAFTFMHRDDVRWVVFNLRQMYDRSIEFGESYYRLMSRTGDFLYLRTRGYLEVDKKTKAVQSFVCVNSIMPEEEGQKNIEEMKRKYSVIAQLENALEQSNHTSTDESPIEDPQNLKTVIKHLVTDLNPATGQCTDLTIIPPDHNMIEMAIQNSLPVISKASMHLNRPAGNKKRSISQSGCESECESGVLVKRTIQ